MPIIDVEMVCDLDETLSPDLARRLSDGLGAALSAPTGTLWVRLRVLDRTHYAENGQAAPDPVFVTVLARLAPAAADLAAQIATITATVARVTDRPPAHVHVMFEASGSGRVAFGGDLVG